MAAILREGGVSDYSFFLHPETRQLLGRLLIEDEALFAAIPETETCERWWQCMADIMPTNEGNSPVPQELHPVFHSE